MTSTLQAVLYRFELPKELAASVSSRPTEIPDTGRATLADLFGDLGFRRGVEVGVEQGEYAEVLCRANPGGEYIGVDAWKAYRGYRDHVGQRKLDGFYRATQKRLEPYPNARLIREYSTRASRQFEDGSLDWVYLDGNHSFESVTADLVAWSPKLKVGGIMSGHDYVRYRLPNLIHVVQAINGWTDAYEIRPWFILGQNAKIPGEIRDVSRSWFWVHDPARFDGMTRLKQ